MQLIAPKTYRRLFCLMIISLSVSLSIFTSPIDNRNFFLIGVMFLGPIIVILSKEFIPRIDIPLVFLMLYSVISQSLAYPQTFRYSTVFFSCMFYCFFMAIVRAFIGSRLKVSILLNLLKYIIYAYFVVLLIQQICVLFNLPVFNLVLDFSQYNKWKLNSLSAEPSHTSRYVGILMFAYLVLCDKYNGKEISFLSSVRRDKLLWIFFFWIMLTIQSGTAILIIGLVILKFMKPGNSLIIVTLIMIGILMGYNMDFMPVVRVVKFLGAVVTGNPQLIVDADSSAAVRVVPDILCVNRIDWDNIKVLFCGEGIDSSKEWLYKYLRYMGESNYGALGKFMLEYGPLVCITYVLFALSNCLILRYIISTIGFFMVCVLFNGVNSQAAWLCISLMFICNNVQIDKNKICRVPKLRIDRA